MTKQKQFQEDVGNSKADPIYATNLHPNTLIKFVGADKPVKISDIAGVRFKYVVTKRDGDKLVDVQSLASVIKGKPKKMVNVVMADGTVFTVTPETRFAVADDSLKKASNLINQEVVVAEGKYATIISVNDAGTCDSYGLDIIDNDGVYEAFIYNEHTPVSVLVHHVGL